MKVGIDTIGFYTPLYYLNLKTLAQEQGVDGNKFYKNLGLNKMAITPPNEDIVTMAASAAAPILSEEIKPQINMVLFATESGLDYSKATGIYVHKLLGLNSSCRVIELKQACYAATFGLQAAMAILRSNPQGKILLIASDVARYERNTSGEYSQGAGAVAMLLTAAPRLLALEETASFYVEDTMDFWRPNYRNEPLVFGKYSCELYLRVLEKTWRQYSKLFERKLSDHQNFCYHVPVPKLVEKAHQRLINISKEKEIADAHLSLIYSREVGNCYTASLYISLLSLLENSSEDLTDNRIGLYSYGSGCSGEYFSAVVQAKYQEVLKKDYHQNLFLTRTELSFQKYLDFYNFTLPVNGAELRIPQYKTGKFQLHAFKEHKRIYGSCAEETI